MKKYLLMLAALTSIALYSCKDATTENTAEATPENTEVQADAPATELTPTGDAEKDAQACVDFMVKAIEETDFTNEESQKKLEETIKATQEKFETFYNEKGEEAKKAFDEAGKKASESIKLEELMTKKAMEALDAAKDKLKEGQK